MEPDNSSAPRPLRIGDPAPDFRARTTAGEIRLSALRGKWVMFFSHPADFTPVCSTEFAEFARRQEEFESRNCALLGLSVDSLYSHVAWLKALKDLFGVEVRFPVIEDPSMAIGRAYGMIDEQSASSATMRSTFFIDPAGVIRATLCYPHNVGRSTEELLRLLAALQLVSTEPVLTPEGWQPGRRVLRLPPEHPAEGEDWFCRYEENGS